MNRWRLVLPVPTTVRVVAVVTTKSHSFVRVVMDTHQPSVLSIVLTMELQRGTRATVSATTWPALLLNLLVLVVSLFVFHKLMSPRRWRGACRSTWTTGTIRSHRTTRTTWPTRLRRRHWCNRTSRSNRCHGSGRTHGCHGANGSNGSYRTSRIKYLDR